MAILGGVGGGMGGLVSMSLFKTFEWWSIPIASLIVLIPIIVAMCLFVPLVPKEADEIATQS